ncbi:nanos homolog 3 [Patagioenas fasciata]|uniref:Proline-rich receptor-like protein kinase PERK9-like n=1 Tax=Patagioenas fasciata monilis TaxID=372326 RepID=A0A1V4JZL1_PATFA|nr:proline-rich receptor-like protein kinase PERK9-like [Patagioenas fasciata monilis]
MEPGPAFDMWRDYLGLSAALASPSPPPEPDRAGEEPAAPEQADPAPVPSGKAACAFCKHNGEARQVYGGHSLRDAGGRILCPVLRSYVCPQCGATKDRAHTKRFCPLTHRGYTSVYARPPRGGAGKRASSDAEK